jgi:hypothetical protein
MSKAMLPAPKVFVVPELMADEPVEEGGLLAEHLEAGRRRGGEGGVRRRLETYLKDPGVARKPPDEKWPSAGQLAGMSDVARQRWLTWEAQHWVDSSLRKILGGKAPKQIFKLEPKKHSRPRSAARDRNMCAEVLRLMERCDYSRSEAVERVAKVFSVTPRAVERATALWAWDAQGKKERHRFVPAWEQQLRNAGKLK